ncbi:cell shape determination protein CcmA [Pseudoxanthomonas kalamensis DSM 18571]|uniref:bactofilin family protein n=1 Tax=Pseudoxanthomonas kalamensis TaxID=289483 RepID=UPI001390EF87|nr:polymer-forming cytoskeletal protein [Pseudoxanthomonas kalamensis]KAF1712614.1 cell shape determination protein CcmA [Pseudoxanthomonas kalamensis DSM 18571]
MLKQKRPNPDGTQIDTLIGAHVTLRGDISFSGGLYVEGRIHGTVVAEEGQAAILTLSEQGSIEGEVRAPVVIVNGRLHGDVYASEKVELAAKARVQGNIHYKVVEMSAGATLTGRLIHADAETESPALSAVPSSRPAANGD